MKWIDIEFRHHGALLCYNFYKIQTCTHDQWVNKSVPHAWFKASQSLRTSTGSRAHTRTLWITDWHWTWLALYISRSIIDEVYSELNPTDLWSPSHTTNNSSVCRTQSTGTRHRKKAPAAVLCGLTRRPRPGWRSLPRGAALPGWVALLSAAGPPGVPREQTAEMTWCQSG